MTTEITTLPILGLTMKSVVVNRDLDEIRFTVDDGRVFSMMHLQDCCESVTIDDICGEIEWLVGSPITQAIETSREANEDEHHGSATWTFYRIGTAKGLVVIRWIGSSNGYYSERVSFFRAGHD